MSPGSRFSLLTLILALFGSALFICGRASAQGTPVLAFSTFLGGSNYDIDEAIAIDDDGNLYVAGYTYSANFPVGPPSPGTYDGFVAKYSPAGQLLDTALLGGSGQDYCLGVAVRGTQRPQRFFWVKKKKHQLFLGYGLLLAFQSSGIEDKTKRKQRAQRSFLESPLAVLIFRDGWKRGLLSPLHPVPGHLAISTSAFSATSAVKFIFHGSPWRLAQGPQGLRPFSFTFGV